MSGLPGTSRRAGGQRIPRVLRTHPKEQPRHERLAALRGPDPQHRATTWASQYRKRRLGPRGGDRPRSQRWCRRAGTSGRPRDASHRACPTASVCHRRQRLAATTGPHDRDPAENAPPAPRSWCVARQPSTLCRTTATRQRRAVSCPTTGAPTTRSRPLRFERRRRPQHQALHPPHAQCGSA